MLRKLELLIPPFVLAVICAVCIWRAPSIWPGGSITFFPFRFVFFLGTLILSTLLFVACGRVFKKYQTTVSPMHPENASKLITEGIFKKSRNPIYLAVLIFLIGWSVYWAHWADFGILAFFVIYMNRFQIIPEERALLKLFGTEYSDYCTRVRRWI